MSAPDPAHHAAILENVRLAAGCGADPSMLLAVAAASMGDVGVGDAIATLSILEGEITDIARRTRAPHTRLAELDPALRVSPEVGEMRLDDDEHLLRGRALYGDLLGKRSFFQVAALAIAGVELDRRDADLLEQLGVTTQLADPRIWPLTVTRRIASAGGSLGRSVVAGLASLCTPHMTALPVAGFMRFLDGLELASGRCGVDAAVAGVLERGEIVPGAGRPVLRGDERVPRQLDLARRYDRFDGPSMRLARELDEVLARRKGVRVNSAGFQGAIMRDMGFKPDAAGAFCLLYFIVPLLSHASAGTEWRYARSRDGAFAQNRRALAQPTLTTSSNLPSDQYLSTASRT